MTGKAISFDGTLYRALNPLYAAEPLSGAVAARFGGRFNSKGTPALYMTLSIQTAILEINQVGSLQPTTLVAYEASLKSVFDATDDAALKGYDITPQTLASQTWRDEMRADGQSKTQDFATRLMDAGYSAMKVPSFARGAKASDVNLVLWSWNDGTNSLCVIDDDGRL